MGGKVGKAMWTLGAVMKRWKYLVLALIIAMTTFAGNFYTSNFKLLLSETSTPDVFFKLLGDLFVGGITNYPWHTIIMLGIISVLTGIVIALIVFKLRLKTRVKNQGGVKATFGIILGLLAPSCASCGLGLISIVGLSSVPVFLPFKGMEIGILSIALLAYSIYSLCYNMSECKECKI